MILNIPNDTNVYDYSEGIVRIGDKDTLTVCDKYGNKSTIPIGDTEDVCVKDYGTGIIIGENSELPSLGSVPPRKWKLLGGEEWDRRNFLMEAFHYTEKDGPMLLFTVDDDGDDLYKNLREALRIMPFYGVKVAHHTFDEGELIALDGGRPVCFVNKMLPYNEKELRDHVLYWRSGGWFSTLRPVDDAYIHEVLSDGVFWEGEKGHPDILPIILDKSEKHTLKCKTVEVSNGYGVDLGKLFIN
jgi:hypothetical protein